MTIYRFNEKRERGMRCKIAQWDYSVETSLRNASYATLGPVPSVQKLGGSIEYPRRDALGLKGPKTRPFNKREGTKGKELHSSVKST